MTPEKILERRCHRLWVRAKKDYTRADNAYRAAERAWHDAHKKMITAEIAWEKARVARLMAVKGKENK